MDVLPARSRLRGGGVTGTSFKPSTRKLILTVHLICSVGWIGVDGCLFALAVTGFSNDEPTSRGAYAAMSTLCTDVLVPLALGALATGLLLGAGTRWGLLRHYWVEATLWVTIAMVAASTLILAPLVRSAASDARSLPRLNVGQFAHARVGLLVAFSAELTALCLVTLLNVVKPWGLTRRGRRTATGAGTSVRRASGSALSPRSAADLDG